VSQLDVRIVLGLHRRHHRPPALRHLQHVGLVDRRDVAVAMLGALKGDVGNPFNLVVGVDHRVGCAPVGRAARRAEVDAAGQLADEEDVGVGHAFGAQGGGVGQALRHEDGPEIGVDGEGLSQREEAALGAFVAGAVVPLRAADGPEQHGVAVEARRAGGVGQGRVGRVEGRAAYEVFLRGNGKAVGRSGRLQHAKRLSRHLRADAVSRKTGNFVRVGVCH
jgi:hypothetical protein